VLFYLVEGHEFQRGAERVADVDAEDGTYSLAVPRAFAQGGLCGHGVKVSREGLGML